MFFSSRKKSIASSELSCLINWCVLFSWLGPSVIRHYVHSASIAIKYTCPAPNYFAWRGKTKWDVNNDQLKRLDNLTKINRGIPSAEQFSECAFILCNVKITHYSYDVTIRVRFKRNSRRRYKRRAEKNAKWWIPLSRGRRLIATNASKLRIDVDRYNSDNSRNRIDNDPSVVVCISFYRSCAYLQSYRKHLGRATTRASRRLLRKPQTSFFNYEPSRCTQLTCYGWAHK